MNGKQINQQQIELGANPATVDIGRESEVCEVEGKRRFRLLTDDDLLAMRPTVREEIAELLENAASYLRRYPDGSGDGSAAWRIADAGLMLRHKIESPKSGWTNVGGVHYATGRGAVLPKQEPDEQQ